MKRMRFDPDRSDLAMFDRGWAGLALIVAQLAAMVVALAPSGARRVQRFALAAESLARRMLLAEALRRALPKIRPLSRAARERLARRVWTCRLAPHDPAAPPPVERAASLSLAEALPSHAVASALRPPSHGQGPSIRSFDSSAIAVRVWSTDPRRNPGPAPVPVDPARLLSRRVDALRSVIDRRARHVARMGRWLARAQHANAREGRGRVSPLRIGFAPGQLRTRRLRSDHHVLLADAGFLAQRALAASLPHARDGPS